MKNKNSMTLKEIHKKLDEELKKIGVIK